MNQDELIKKLALLFLPNFGHKRIKSILAHLDSVEDFFSVKKQTLKKIPNIGENLIRSLNRDQALRSAEQYLPYFEKNPDIQIHFYQDENYSYKLKECDDAPILLFSKGKLNINSTKSVAIVGTRNASSYGKMLCHQLIEGFKGRDVQIVSGLAFGIDILAHQLCVMNEIETVAVLGHGLDRIYPFEHKKIAYNMLENGGLLTEFLPGTIPDKENFPMRNRIVAGMCDATIVIESGAKGGSLITAELAFDYNREVFAFPGEVNKTQSMGCNNLIKKNKAHLITSVKDVFEILNWNKNPVSKQKDLPLFSLDESELKIMNFFTTKSELYYDELFLLSSFGHSSLNETLFHLEMKGFLKSLPGKKYKVLN
ncbi:MAG: DNA-protecting protein DprA [Flavobacteriia bacterium]|nr:DNA-protecting protein DprA [Flavobacteriia bacterium]